jgi:uncharacterized protein
MADGRKVVLPGGSGYLGRHLARRLRDRGDEVVVLTRGPAGERSGVRHVAWDGRDVGPWASELEGADAIVHLAGRRVDVRPTRRNIDTLIRSRVEPVVAVGRALQQSTAPPPVWVQIATLAIFGDTGDETLDETSVPSGIGPAQMVTVALAWEHAFRTAAKSERAVLLRCGVTIGPGDPATAQLTRLARLGLGGPIGSGRQWLSWIALDDLLDVLERALDEDGMDGLYHVTSPNPVRNRELMAAIRKTVGRRRGRPSPAPLTRMGAWIMGSDPELALTGRRALPDRLQSDGHRFALPTIDAALARANSQTPAASMGRHRQASRER